MIGDTLSAPDRADPALPPLEIEEPTVSMLFLVNSGPFAGQEGQAVTLRQIKDRLDRELRVNAALRVEDLGRPDGVKVSGRGELHLGILIEEMRREGMELCVSRPEVITQRDEQGRLLEPMEELTVDVPNEYRGIVIEKLAQRKGELTGMYNAGTGAARLEISIPTRGLIGYRSDFLTDTHGLGIMAARFVGYGPWRGEMTPREQGSLVSMENGVATGYSLENLQAHGTLFISPMDPVYEGMIVGEHSRSGDLACNPTKTKKLGNYRAETKEIDIGLKVPWKMTLDQALEWSVDDELVEITPSRCEYARPSSAPRTASAPIAPPPRGSNRPQQNMPTGIGPYGRYCSSIWTISCPSRTIHQGTSANQEASSGGESPKKLRNSAQVAGCSMTPPHVDVVMATDGDTVNSRSFEFSFLMK